MYLLEVQAVSLSLPALPKDSFFKPNFCATASFSGIVMGISPHSCPLGFVLDIIIFKFSSVGGCNKNFPILDCSYRDFQVFLQ